MSVVHPGVPEEIAIAGAKLLVQLRAIFKGGEVLLRPADVVRMGDRFHHISIGIADFLKACDLGDGADVQASKLLSAFDADGCAPGCSSTVPEDVQPLYDSRLSVEDFLEFQRLWKHVYYGRQASTIEDWSIYGKPYKHRPYSAEVASHFELNDAYTLEHVGFKAPVFALADGVKFSKRRFTQVATQECQCNAPWHQRSLWERQPWVAYELPPPSGDWQPRWVEAESCRVWHRLVEPGFDFPDTREMPAEDAKMMCAQPLAVPRSVNHPPQDVTSEGSARQDAPASGSAVPSQTCKMQAGGVAKSGDLLMWAASDADDVSGDVAELQGSDEEDMSSDVAESDADDVEECSKLGEESAESESLDVDPLESGDGCPMTPSCRRAEEGETPETSAPQARRKLNDVWDEVRGDVCCLPWGDVLGDDSSDDRASEDLYCNESEQ